MQNRMYIDKTELLEKGIHQFPSIYISGAAAAGKSTLVKMMVNKHPEKKVHMIDMEREEKLTEDIFQMEYDWIIVENINRKLSDEEGKSFQRLVRGIPEDCKVIFVGREYPSERFLDMFWKNEIQFVQQSDLPFTRKETEYLIRISGSALNAAEIYKVTDGWPGYTNALIRSAELRRNSDIEFLRNTYETRRYIETEITGTLSEKEQRIVTYMKLCPWVNLELCREIWEMDEPEEILRRAETKGILIYNKINRQWRLGNIFADYPIEISDEYKRMSEKYGRWYEQHGFIKEALECLKRAGAKADYQKCMLDHYSQVPFIDDRYSEEDIGKEKNLKYIYLRAMHAFFGQEQEKFRSELKAAENWLAQDVEEEFCKKEIILNLKFVDASCTLKEWLELLEEYGEKKRKFHLYNMLGTGVTFLCGMRDLSGMFSCTKAEEKAMAHIFRENLGDREWKAYCLAQIEYCLETRQKDIIRDDNKELIEWAVSHADWKKDPEFGTAGIYLYFKWHEIRELLGDAIQLEDLRELADASENQICKKNMEAIMNIYSLWVGEPEQLTNWLMTDYQKDFEQINEDNYMEMSCRAKGYLLLGYYDKAEKILEKVGEYLKRRGYYRIQAEAMFMLAVISWGKERRGQAIRYMIESMIISETYRYVTFYTQYGKIGYELLEEYAGWFEQNNPESVNRKKKYNYGNILRMPVGDYIQVICRSAKKETRTYTEVVKLIDQDRLTMMETIVLQSMSHGMTNADICKEQNLKITTVKKHIYNIYKKLEVNNRVQAINKGKELGIVR